MEAQGWGHAFLDPEKINQKLIFSLYSTKKDQPKVDLSLLGTEKDQPKDDLFLLINEKDQPKSLIFPLHRMMQLAMCNAARPCSYWSEGFATASKSPLARSLRSVA